MEIIILKISGGFFPLSFPDYFEAGKKIQAFLLNIQELQGNSKKCHLFVKENVHNFKPIITERS